MTILLLILKIIGILLLSLIGIVLLLLALVLFVPVRYRVEGNIEDTRQILGKVHWLLHLVSVSFSYEEGQFGYSLRICGIRVLPGKKKTSALDDVDFDDVDFDDAESGDKASEMSAAEERTQEENGSAGNDRDNKIQPPDADVTNDEEILITPEKKNSTESKKAISKEKIRSFFEKIKRTVSNLLHFLKQLPEKIEDIKNLLTDETNKKSVSLVWGELKYLLRHFRFRKIKTDLSFSTGDPAVTGQVLGVLCIFPMLYQYEINIYPDFETEKFYVRGNFFIKGHIRLFHVLVSAIRLWKEKEFRRFVKRILKKLER